MNLLGKFRRLPLTVRVPVTVAVLMIAVSAAISERVLNRLTKTQEAYLNGLAASYIEGISASTLPSVLRQDSWEIFDTLERMQPRGSTISPTETVVTTANDIILASDNPALRKTLSALDPEFTGLFRPEGVNIDAASGNAYQWRAISHQGQTIGKVFAVFDASPLLAERQQVLMTLLITNGILTLVLGLVGSVTVRRMIRPMEVLEKHMLDAARGAPSIITQSEFPKADREAVRMYEAFNTFVRADKERQNLTRQLADEERLAGLGRLASGMAHEINNPLGGLMNAVDTLRKHGHNTSTRMRALSLIERGLQGIADVVRAALATYRPERLSRPMSERDFSDLRLLLGPELRRKDQAFDLDISGMRPDSTNRSAGPMRQALLNLLLNAIAVTPQSGSVRVDAKHAGDTLVIEVSDEGSGMPRVYRTLLTGDTAPALPEQSAGLGLWIVRQIADELGGFITVNERPGGGTLVTMTFPPAGQERLSDAA